MNKTTTIKLWNEQERPREKLLSKGPNSLSDAELLAIFLRNGPPGINAVDFARTLLCEFGSLRAILNLSPAKIDNIKGIGKAKYSLLQAAVEIGKRHWQEKLNLSNILGDTETTKQFLIKQLRDKQQEIFACIYLDNKNKVISFEEVFTGTINKAKIYPREIVRKTLELNAAAVIFSHNHPSGNIMPSLADKKLTSLLVKALKLVDIKVLDHIIVGDGEALSFAETGLMEYL